MQPFLEGLTRRLDADGALWKVMVVQLQVVEQGRLQTGAAVETGLLQELADATVEALHHAVRLWVMRRCEAVFCPMRAQALSNILKLSLKKHEYEQRRTD